MSSSETEAHFLRATFDDSAELYDRTRAVAPDELFDDLIALAGLKPGALLLEIGCGTGQATLPLAERGFDIVAIELGESLADVARRKFRRFSNVRIVTSSFEDWDAAGELFDGVVAFNSFHWIDPELRFAKSAEILRDGGALAVVGMRFVVHVGADAVWMALQEDHEGVGISEPRLHVDDAKDRSAEFVAGGHFRSVTLRRYLWDITFDADQYVDLLRTSSRYRSIAESVRRELFERIHARISRAGTITPTIAAVLYVAERA